MLRIYRRHEKNCKHRNKGRKYRQSRCALWADGLLGGVEIRKSLSTRSFEEANEKVHGWEASGKAIKISEEEPITVELARDQFLLEVKVVRNLQKSSIRQYRALFRQMLSFAEQTGIKYLKEFDLKTLKEFRSSWLLRSSSARTRLGLMRAFFRFAVESKWVSENYAKQIQKPKVTGPPTFPFSREEWLQILAACDRYGYKRNQLGREDSMRVRAMVLSLRYSGLRIGDTVGLDRTRISGDKLFLRTAKTKTRVFIPLPGTVIDALKACPGGNDKYFFWNGTSKFESAVALWQRRLRHLFRLAGVPDGHAHRFRDTFAVELLLAGVPIDRVSALLGHSSVAITELHYGPWVRARQEQAEADVRRTWPTEDPSASVQDEGYKKGTHD